MPSKSQYLRPRLCALEKGDNGYGFHLHGEKGKTGQFIRLVEPDSPAESSGLRAGDRLAFVNGEDVENESHQQVVSRIRATAGLLELIVVDQETEQLLKRHNLKCQKEYVTEGVPVEEDEEEEEEERQVHEEEVVNEQNVDGTENGEVKEEDVDEEVVVEVNTDVEVVEERHEEANEETNEETHEETNGETHEETHEETNGETHEETHEEIREEIREEDAQQEDVTPRQSTPVPEQVHESNGDIHIHVEKQLSINSDKGSEKGESTTLRPRLCVIQRGPNGYGFNLHSERARPGQFIRAVDEDSPAERAGLQPQDRIVQVNGVSVEGKTHSQVVSIIKAGGTETRLLVGLITDAIPALNLSLQQVKELAHQKRSNKRAPTMDWTKKNELFSNL
ncbi:hypothetical protein WMY93_003033 [Mugilogobius chulae]|uniref:Na(+)/H(+) exchange regulatory cofactor NHE-RF1 n=1 Tax=Mugilogobius chulae TaxID=88201 RepID=A0AAW0PYS8_9GOBI